MATSERERRERRAISNRQIANELLRREASLHLGRPLLFPVPPAALDVYANLLTGDQPNEVLFEDFAVRNEIDRVLPHTKLAIDPSAYAQRPEILVHAQPPDGTLHRLSYQLEHVGRLRQLQRSQNCFMNTLIYAMFVGSSVYDPLFNQIKGRDLTETIQIAFLRLIGQRVINNIRIEHSTYPPFPANDFTVDEYRRMLHTEVIDEQVKDFDLPAFVNAFPNLALDMKDAETPRGARQVLYNYFLPEALFIEGRACSNDEFFTYFSRMFPPTLARALLFERQVFYISRLSQIEQGPVNSTEDGSFLVKTKEMRPYENALQYFVDTTLRWYTGAAVDMVNNMAERNVPWTVPVALVLRVDRSVSRISHYRNVEPVYDTKPEEKPIGIDERFTFRRFFPDTSSAIRQDAFDQTALDAEFRLFSYVCWFGSHYKVVVRCPDPQNSDEWWLLDGTYGRAVSTSNTGTMTVTQDLFRGSYADPDHIDPRLHGLMFFYERVNPARQ